MLNPFNHQTFPDSNHMQHFLGDSFAGLLPENQAYYIPDAAPASRKRHRDQSCAVPANLSALQKSEALSLAAAGGAPPQIQQFQTDIDLLIADHSKRIRVEVAERQKQQAMQLAGTIGGSVIRKLKEKDDQIQRMGKLNLVLQEKLKSLYVENQLLRDLAQSNEAAANSLRTNLQQVLLHAGSKAPDPDAAAAEEEVGSCCGSIDDGVGEEDGRNWYGDRRCRMCGDRESCVLVLPCRHLCLCEVCGSGSHRVPACPVCLSTITANLRINLCNLN